ncbi:glycosyltransferase [Cognatishimia activa]|uniref:Galactofuranosyl transferase GlfT2 n=1 Tax=Cognatishimia activa TaxID=1715691 RepID=A0A0P1IV44_9RHOB|nr:glycosyltransferase [Cognatishimia activa]CUJ16980.1 Galactofuranosyl transferase GlfT2 [Cognatishimia activa]CUK25831.1 Galactofuranosyl transferase GlfT2 [Cognatishimia activa]
MIAHPTGIHVVQSLQLPEVDLGSTPEIYVRLSGDADVAPDGQTLEFRAGGSADFGTYSNLFNVERWHRHCDLNDLSVAVRGQGRFEFSIHLARAGRSTECLHTEVIELTDTQPFQHAVPITSETTQGICFVVLRALEAGKIFGIDWQTTDAPRRIPSLLLSITTFRREETVRKTVQRLRSFISQSPCRDFLHLAVVDNGQSAKIITEKHVTAIENENLGGSGGFARGLLEAQNRGFTHCLFMDDDASVHTNAIERTWNFLAYSKDEKTAVAGALAHSQERWRLWENGAVFHQLCQTQHGGIDLRDEAQVTKMEHESAGIRPDNFYGGWWYFAFPVSGVKHLPFPFFVRGDDVSFSLAHDFNTVTLNGVISYQDEDFTVKETPQTVYLDLRSHLAHHLCLPDRDIGRAGILQIIWRFYIRALLSFHYETLAASNLALQDVLAGPDFFRENADMSKRRSDINALFNQERWRDFSEAQSDHPSDREKLPARNATWRFLLEQTANGHLFPGFARFGNRITLPATQRGLLDRIWGASQITYKSVDGKRYYTVRHNKARAWKESLVTFKAALRFWREHQRLTKEWRRGYQELTQRAFWLDRLNVSDPRSGQAE